MEQINSLTQLRDSVTAAHQQQLANFEAMKAAAQQTFRTSLHHINQQARIEGEVCGSGL